MKPETWNAWLRLIRVGFKFGLSVLFMRWNICNTESSFGRDIKILFDLREVRLKRFWLKRIRLIIKHHFSPLTFFSEPMNISALSNPVTNLFPGPRLNPLASVFTSLKPRLCETLKIYSHTHTHTQIKNNNNNLTLFSLKQAKVKVQRGTNIETMANQRNERTERSTLRSQEQIVNN